MNIAQAAELMDEKSAKLLAALQDFAQKNKLSDAELQEALGKIVLKSINFQKGGFGIIDKNTFISLREKRNTLLINKKEWNGQPASEQEIVITDGNNTKSTGKIDTKKSIIVIFSPTEVQYIDLSTNTGGKYLRQTSP